MRKNNISPEKDLIDRVKSDARKKLVAQKKGKEIMFGLGMSGTVGWSITVPTLLGIAIGMYLDKKFYAGFSWTLTFLFAGLISGCISAWYWVKRKIDED